MRGRTGKLLLIVASVLVTFLLCAAGAAGAAVLLRVGVVWNEAYAERESERLWRDADRRVLVLGDSFFVPYGLTGRLVAEGLAESGIAVRNLAVNGKGPFEYLEQLKGAGDEPRPDAVLLGYYVGNDLTDVQNNPQFNPRPRGTAIRPSPPRASPPKVSPGTRGERLDGLYLWRYLRKHPAEDRSFDWARFEAAGIDPEMVEAAKARRVNPWLLRAALRNPDYLLDNLLMESAANQRAWLKTRELLAAIHEETRARKARLLVVVFPRSIQINDSRFEFFRKLTFRVDERTLTSRRPQELVARFCEERGIAMLDLLPVFEERVAEDLYLDMDDHFDADGHRLAADRIVSFVAPFLASGT